MRKLVLLLVGLVGCSDPVAVRPVDVVAKSHIAGHYHLVRWNGQPLPAFFSVNLTCGPDPAEPCVQTGETHIVSGDLTVLEGQYTVEWHYRRTFPDSVTTWTGILRGTYAVGMLYFPGGQGGMTVTFSGDTATVRCCKFGSSPVGPEVYLFTRSH